MFERKHQGLALNSMMLKLTPIAAGCVVLLSTTTGMAYAQQADTAVTQDGATNTVFVTGIRKGIEDAISIKKNSSSIVEAISAEDIGKLPDQSIAESIARLPGVAAQRVAGRAQALSVRGLSPDFATTLMNGREQVSTGDNRSVEFDQYPSELMSGVVIYKTPDAGLVGQGLSGTIDMQTVSPLNFPARTISMNVRGEKNSLGSIANTKATGNRASVSYIDQFADRTVGIALGFAHLETPRLDNEVGLYEPWQIQSQPGVPTGAYYMDGIKSLATSGTIKRDGFLGVLEFKPSKNWTSKLDVFASKFSDVETANQFEFNLGNYNGGNTPGLNWNSITVNSNNTVTGGVASGIYPLVRGEYNDCQDSIHSAGWANTFKFEHVKVLADLNYSAAKRDETYQEINTQLLTPGGTAVLDTMTVNWATGGFPTLSGLQNYSNASQLNLRNTIYGSGYGRKPHVEDKLSGGKLVATFDAPELIQGFVSDIDVGVNYTGRTKKKRQPEASENLLTTNAVISPDLLYAPVNLGFAGSGTIPSFNVPGVIAKYYQPWNPSPIDPGAVQRAWDVKEDVVTTFVKANLDSTVGSVPMKGNVGVQIVNTDQSSSSVYSVGGSSTLTPVDVGAKYTDVLPSMNLAFDMGNDDTIRVGLAKQLARARVDDMRASYSFSIDNVTRLPSANGGNPKLDPWKANALDVSYEKYFGKKAYVAVAGYYKKLTSYIYSQTKPYDFSAETATATSPSGLTAVSNIGGYTSMYNGQGGSIQGAELSASLPLSMLTPVLDGFGVQASTTITNSSITIPSATFAVGTNIPLPGMSKNVSNLTAYYEKNGFEARISDRRRSDFIGEIGNFAGDRNLRYVVGENVVDAQIGYAFETGTYKGLSVLFQVNNLNNSAYQTYQNSKDRVLEYEKFGRSFLFGLTYKM
ncbi:TonB-dependent receptor [Sapientia aquatica]|uniref:TonB-dependent receptor n=2 Tax=Sapientia aquatica TaxID=1549640 RepID=A0A4R5VTF5_9BURK|nr:TonB-dependent receptor [Sapientia aquatica]